MTEQDLASRIEAAVSAQREQLIATRRDIHRHPELAFHEERTAALVAGRLEALGLRVQRGVARTGVVGLLEGARPGPTVLVRADMDGLPIQERSDAPYASANPGVMHACGHDGHVAMALAVAEALARHRAELPGAVKLAFQPAEEKEGGAKPMIAEGVLEQPRVDAVLAIHLDNTAPVGKIAVLPGPIAASSDEIGIVLRGKGGHAAEPYLTSDPILAGSQIVVALHAALGRSFPATRAPVLSICAFHGGDAHNVIPREVQLKGTFRTLDRDVRAKLPELIERTVAAIAGLTGLEHAVTIRHGYPPTVNDAGMAALVAREAASVVGSDNVVAGDPTMGAEDFSYFLEARPGCMFFVGSANAARGLDSPHHSPTFDYDEDALLHGARTMARSVVATLLNGVPAREGAVG